MIPQPRPDSRFAMPADPRCAACRTILKASGRRTVALPTSAQAQAERPFWGKHWDRDVSRIEEEFYRWGQRFLVGLLSGALGRAVAPRTLVKAGFVNPEAPVEGWGRVLDLFDSSRLPSDLLDGWDRVITNLTDSLAPTGSADGAAEVLALRARLMFLAGEKVRFAPKMLPPWDQVLKDSTAYQRASMEWTRVRGVEYARNLTESARHSLVCALVESKQAGEGPKALERRLLDGFGQLNRDWRRLALTESAMAVQNAVLASVNPADGWIAVWVAAPTACPYCLAQHHRRFRVVAADDPARNGVTDLWVGKNNIGRSAHRYSTKLGRYRERPEMWWPCVPVHPTCACLLTLRRSRPGPLRPSLSE